jgi:hypothetical protein
MNLKIFSLLIISAAIICLICPVQAEADAGQSEQITIMASADGSYYNGELITFSGTNMESDYTYLFITGPTLNSNGVRLDDISTPVITGNGDTFAKAEVGTDNKWKFEIDTNLRNLEPGTNTVYAVTEPNNKEDLSNGTYDLASIVIKKPFITADVSKPVIQRGEELVITGSAEWMPHSIAVWVIGYGYWNGAETGSMVTLVPEDDGSYRYVLGGDETTNLEDGEYYVIVQHPMYNDEFNVITEDDSFGDGVLVTGIAAGTQEKNGPGFYISGNSALRGSYAAEALIEEIDSADIDDTYSKCTFRVEGSIEKGQSQDGEDQPGNDRPGKNIDNSIFAAIGDLFEVISG